MCHNSSLVQGATLSEHNVRIRALAPFIIGSTDNSTACSALWVSPKVLFFSVSCFFLVLPFGDRFQLNNHTFDLNG